jgi:hypothetical protein
MSKNQVVEENPIVEEQPSPQHGGCGCRSRGQRFGKWRKWMKSSSDEDQEEQQENPEQTASDDESDKCKKFKRCWKRKMFRKMMRNRCMKKHGMSPCGGMGDE